ncbi:Metal homeostasis factor ATX1 [Cyberlindnera fabianii]|uniref:Metal homeostasis factor ATX1 n=1 Tax=Cyberlindnera fabianii TaxID=36022 RepID=A0A1V2KZ64_CYBFA|nr:Metal homeostasis factor ATX1 [Cyberlindnera fabianii]
MSHQYHFDVKMTCGDNPEISNLDVSLEKQSVDVTTSLSYDDVLATIKKTGKEVLGGKVIQ